MRFMLVGADCEENLGMCMISAAAAACGHKVKVLAFDSASQTDAVVRSILDHDPGCVGLAVQFQHRGLEFLTVAMKLRQHGYRGHITCGGQFPSMAFREVLEGPFGIDSVVIHEGDHSIGQLLDAIEKRTTLSEVFGIARLDRDGKAVRNQSRPLIADLDTLPIARRYRAHSRHFGIPFIPIWGSRGCWGRCTYCSISTCFRDARQHGGGNTLRLRSPQNLATEMAVLWHAAGGAAIFCFHDENLLLPKPSDTLARVTELRSWLDEYGVGKAALVGKCRPESLTAELAKQLRELGVIRLYVGVENASQRSADHLNRRTTAQSIQNALEACQLAGIFPCYNLLLFEPDATLEDVEQNVVFMRRNATVPVNFCRAEPYHGTPLYEGLRKTDALGGSFLGWDYRIKDDRTELLFRICSAVFRERNFDARGVTNRSMGLGYAARVLEFFHDKGTGKSASLMRRASELTRMMTLEKCDLLEEAIKLARTAEVSDSGHIERETALLGLRIAAGNRVWHKQLDELIADMSSFGERGAASKLKHIPNRSLMQAMQAIAVMGSLSVAASSCGGKTETGTQQLAADAGKDASKDANSEADAIGPYDALPYDAGTDMQTYDPLPQDAGTDIQGSDPLPQDAGTDIQGPDPLPQDAGTDIQGPDPLPQDGGTDIDGSGPYDALPYDTGVDDEPNVPDFVPQDASLDLGNLLQGKENPAPAPPPAMDKRTAERQQVLEKWIDTGPRRARRSDDLPLYQPPTVTLSASRNGGQIQVTIVGNNGAVGTRWQADGEVIGEGTSVQWVPASDDDQLRVAVRTRGGITIASMRVADLPDKKV